MYEELLCFYVDVKRQPVQSSPPMLSYEDLQKFYVAHVGRSAAPLPPTPEDAMGAVVIEDNVVTRNEAAQAFSTVKENFATMGEEHGRMKEGLQGLVAKLDAVQGETTEDMQTLARNADAALSRASSVVTDLSVHVVHAETQQATAKETAERAQAVSDAALKETANVQRDQQIVHA